MTKRKKVNLFINISVILVPIVGKVDPAELDIQFQIERERLVQRYIIEPCLNDTDLD